MANWTFTGYVTNKPGAGVSGTDCGIFGGTIPYVLSGLPDIPAIYYFTLFNISNTLNVSLKVKSHN